MQLRSRVVDQVECRPDGREVLLSRLRQLELRMLALEQANAQSAFKHRDLPTDGGLGDAQLRRRACEADVACSDFEDPEWVKRGEISTHDHIVCSRPAAYRTDLFKPPSTRMFCPVM